MQPWNMKQPPNKATITILSVYSQACIGMKYNIGYIILVLANVRKNNSRIYTTFMEANVVSSKTMASCRPIPLPWEKRLILLFSACPFLGHSPANNQTWPQKDKD